MKKIVNLGIAFCIMAIPLKSFACFDCIDILEDHKGMYQEMLWTIACDDQEEVTMYGERLRAYLYAFYTGKIEALDFALEIIKENHPKLKD